MNGQCRKSLSGALTEPNIAQTLSSSRMQDIIDRIRNIIEREFVLALVLHGPSKEVKYHTKVPEFGFIRSVV